MIDKRNRHFPTPKLDLFLHGYSGALIRSSARTRRIVASRRWDKPSLNIKLSARKR